MDTEELKGRLVGKKITDIKVVRSWRTKSINNLSLHLDDGTVLELHGSTDSGCCECDCDGSNETIVEAYFVHDPQNGTQEGAKHFRDERLVGLTDPENWVHKGFTKDSGE